MAEDLKRSEEQIDYQKFRIVNRLIVSVFASFFHFIYFFLGVGRGAKERGLGGGVCRTVQAEKS